MQQGSTRIPRLMWQTTVKYKYEPLYVPLVVLKILGWCICTLLGAGLLIFCFIIDSVYRKIEICSMQKRGLS